MLDVDGRCTFSLYIPSPSRAGAFGGGTWGWRSLARGHLYGKSTWCSCLPSLVRSQTSWHGGGSARSVVFLIPCRRSGLAFVWVVDSWEFLILRKNFSRIFCLGESSSQLQKGIWNWKYLNISKYHKVRCVVPMSMRHISRQSCHHTSLVTTREGMKRALLHHIAPFSTQSVLLLRTPIASSD